MFPGRNRRQLVNKYRRETKYHSRLVDKALKAKVLFGALPRNLQREKGQQCE